mmetsp:Transcript_2709/g.9130  ORF Transcript_2709/g.9130 Transcript_2709/m.9130 type:complete len:235 (+) Transcript_2709:166-870(+)
MHVGPRVSNEGVGSRHGYEFAEELEVVRLEVRASGVSVVFKALAKVEAAEGLEMQARHGCTQLAERAAVVRPHKDLAHKPVKAETLESIDPMLDGNGPGIVAPSDQDGDVGPSELQGLHDRAHPLLDPRLQSPRLAQPAAPHVDALQRQVSNGSVFRSHPSQNVTFVRAVLKILRYLGKTGRRRLEVVAPPTRVVLPEERIALVNEECTAMCLRIHAHVQELSQNGSSAHHSIP